MNNNHNADGALLFVFDNDKFQYSKLAELCSLLVKKHLHLPVHVVTDDPDIGEKFDSHTLCNINQNRQRRAFRFGESSDTIVATWNNAGREQSYDLSPFSGKTLVLDVDYLVMSNRLSVLLNTNADFCCFDSVHDVTGNNSLDSNLMVSFNNIYMKWATVMVFSKTLESRMIFESWKYVKEYYQYYSRLFGFDPIPYRNDYSLSIAMQLISGYFGRNHNIPWKMPTINTSYEITDVITDTGTVKIKNSDKSLTYVKNTDLHVMNKVNLASETVYNGLWNYGLSK